MAYVKGVLKSLPEALLQQIGYPQLHLDENQTYAMVVLFLLLIHVDDEVTDEERSESQRFLEMSTKQTQIDYIDITEQVVGALQAAQLTPEGTQPLMQKACSAFVSKKDKRDVFQQLVMLAQADGELALRETLLLDNISDELGISQEDFEHAFKQASFTHPLATQQRKD